MANFIITCPHCRRQLSAYESWVGTEVECPFCHNIVLVQRPVQQPFQQPQVRVQQPQFQQPFQQPQVRVQQPQFQQPQVRVQQPQFQQQVTSYPENLRAPVREKAPRKPVNKKAVILWSCCGVVALLLVAVVIFGFDLHTPNGVTETDHASVMDELTAEVPGGYPSSLGNSRMSRHCPFDIGTPLTVVKKNSIELIPGESDDSYFVRTKGCSNVILTFDDQKRVKSSYAPVSQDDFQPFLDYLVGKYGKTSGASRDEYADLEWKLYSENVKLVFGSSKGQAFLFISAL